MKDQGNRKKTVMEEMGRFLYMVAFSPGAQKALESDSRVDRDSELVWGCSWSLNF